MAGTRHPTTESVADAEIDAFVARLSRGDLSNVPALSAFQRRMDQYPQLSAEAQLEMVARVREGREAAALAKEAGGEMSRRTLSKIREGERAAEYLVGSNFRLVLLICAEKAKARYGIDRVAEVLPDLVAEANVAMVEAIVNFEPKHGLKFVTYMAMVVRDRVQYVMSRDGAIRVASSWHRLKRIAAVRVPQLTTELGRRPTEDELKADLLEQCMVWAKNRLTPAERALPAAEQEEKMLAKLRKQGMLGAIDSINDVLLLGQSTTSLDAPLGDDGQGTLGDMLAEQEDDGFSQLELAELSEALNAALSGLAERERTIIAMRFGFGTEDRQTYTYAQIGELLGVTAERIRQIENQIMAKLSADETFRHAVASYLPGL